MRSCTGPQAHSFKPTIYISKVNIISGFSATPCGVLYSETHLMPEIQRLLDQNRPVLSLSLLYYSVCSDSCLSSFMQFPVVQFDLALGCCIKYTSPLSKVRYEVCCSLTTTFILIFSSCGIYFSPLVPVFQLMSQQRDEWK